MGQYLKKFGNVTQYDAFAGSANFLLPNVSYIVEQPRKIRYNPRAKRIVPKVTLKYNATENKLLAFNSGSDNIKKLKIDGREISIEPSIVESHEVNVYASAITIDYNGGGAGFPSDYVMSSMPNELRLKPMDPSVKISEVPDVILLGNVDGMGMAEPLPMSEVLGYYFEIDEANNQLVSLSALREEMGTLFDYGYRIGFILGRADYDTMEMEVIDCVQMYAETEGGLQTPYYFSQAGQHTVEMELNSSRFGGAMMFRTDIYNDVNNECGLISAAFSEGVEYIAESTFHGITTLKTLGLTKTMLSIEDYAFYMCSGLTSLSLNEGIVNVGSYAFNRCAGLKGKLTIPNSLRYIAEGTFYGCSGLTSVAFGSGLTSIGKSAFEICHGLTGNLIIPNSVTSIGELAFYNCDKLTSFSLGSGLTSIGSQAFACCYVLAGNLVIPDSVTSIGNFAFANCFKLTSLSLSSGLTNISDRTFYNCSGLTGEVVIPDSVTNIGMQAFEDCYKLSSVSLSSGLTSIGNSAFSGCTGLTCNLVIPDSVTSIGDSAFNNCKGLTSLSLGSGLITIGSNAFWSCDGLTGDLIIPNSVTSIGTLAFYSCYNFNSIVVSAGNTAYDSRNGSNCLIETSGNTVLLGCKTSVIPNTVTSISDYAFYRCSGLTGELVIPDSVTSIGISAFTQCSGLTSLTIGSGLTTIGNYGFAYCRNVKEITIDAVTAPTITSYTFYYVGDNGDLIYPEGSDYSSWLSKNSYYLGYYGWNKVLSTITCTYNVENAGVYTKLCYSTSSIVDIIVDGVSIGTGSTNYAFSTTGEHTVEFTTYNDSIPSYLFNGCTNLTSVIIPDTMLTIGSRAFEYCSGLTGELVIPDSVTSIASYAFADCSGLTSLSLGSGLTTIGQQAFQECTGLISIVIPDSVTSIGDSAFVYCDGLTSVTFGSGLTSIGEQVFGYCRGLRGNLVVPDSVTSIGSYAFSSCSGLTSLSLGSGLTTIGQQAFQYCTGLTEITCNAVTAPTIRDRTFYGVSYFGTFNYPAGSDYSQWLSTDSYYLGYYSWNKEPIIITCTYDVTITTASTRICNNLSYFAYAIVDGVKYSRGNAYTFNTTGEHTIEFALQRDAILAYAFINSQGLISVEIPDSVRSIETSAFSGCTGLTSLVIPDAVTSIGVRAFTGCWNLENIVVSAGNTAYDSRNNSNCLIETSTNTLMYGCKNSVIPNTVTSIGDAAFELCTGLTGELVIPDSVISIGIEAFAICFGLTGELVIPDSVTSIGDKAFSGCTSLTSLSLGGGLTSIGSQAFYYCSGLTEITCNAVIAPTISSQTFYGVPQYGTLNYPEGSDYSQWLSTSSYYLGYYKWNQETYSITCTYDVTGTTSATRIYSRAFGAYAMVVDGTQMALSTGYTFSTTGEHTVEFKMSATTIGASAFTTCYGLTSIELGSGLTSIGDYAFSDCTGLTSIVIPDSVTSIGGRAFASCTDLTSIVVPDSVTSIGASAFNGCGSLMSVSLGSGLTSIGNYAFSACTSLMEITCNAVTAPTISANVFQLLPYFGTLNYPEGSDYSSWLKTDSYYLGYYSWNQGEQPIVTCTYDVTTTTAKTKLCYYATGFTDIVVDGVSIGAVTGYTFSTTGEHTIEYKMKSTTIGASAFTNCYRLISIDIPDLVTSIGSYVFSGCTNITSLVIPDSVTSIGTYAFCHCSGLTEITCNAVTAPTIYSSTFSNVPCYGTLNYPEGSDYSQWLSNSGYYLGYYGWNKEPGVITCTYDVTITTGKTRLCYYATGFTDIIVDGVSIGTGSTGYTFSTTGEHTVEYKMKSTTIVASAFTNCYRMISVDIPDVVASIGNQAFYQCYGLTSIDIPDLVTYIGTYAFSYCSGLTGELVIPDSVTSIGAYAFNDCYGLTGELVIPDLVTSFGYGAFAGTNFNSIVVSSGNTKYDSRNNSNCIIETSTNILRTGCKNSVIPNTVIRIGDSAFNGCHGLTFIDIPDSVTSIGTYAFDGCSNLTGELVIPDSVTSIESSAFTYCNKLTSLSLGSGLTSIGNYAFYYCSGLTEITCNAVTAPTIGNSQTFYGLPYFGTLNYPEGSDYSSWLRTDSYYLGYYAWNEEAPILTCTYDITTTTAKTKLCYYATGLTDIIVDGVSIGTGNTGYTFSTTGEHTVEFKLKTTDVPYYVFNDCYCMISVDIPDGVRSFNSFAFQECTGLTSIVIPDSVTSIGLQAFSSCYGLTGELVIPDSVTRIEENAFGYCSGLIGELVIPDSVTSIGRNPFRGTNFNSIVVSSGNTKYDSRNNSNCIIETSTNTLICGCNNSVIPNTVTRIGYYAFSSCSGLTTIDIPDSVTSIGDSAFNNCKGLTSIDIPASVTSIGSSAFGYCYALTSIVIPDSVTSIGTYGTFQYCTGLTSIVIPDSVTSIGKNAFDSCYSLTSIDIPASVTSIDSWAFTSCSGLTEITCHAVTAPTIGSYITFYGVPYYGTLKYPEGSDYSSWLRTDNYYLGYYGWTGQSI